MVSESIMSNDVRFRNMTENDIPEVVALDLKVTGIQGPVSESGVLDSYVSGGLGLSCVAESQDRLVGYILGRLAYTPPPDVESAWIQLLGVDPAFQRQGIARKLVNSFQQRCHEKGAKIIHVSVPTQNTEVQTFLVNCGFGAAEWVHFIAPVE